MFNCIIFNWSDNKVIIARFCCDTRMHAANNVSFVAPNAIDICYQCVVWRTEGTISPVFRLRLRSILPERFNRASGAQGVVGLHRPRTRDWVHDGHSVRHAGNKRFSTNSVKLRYHWNSSIELFDAFPRHFSI